METHSPPSILAPALAQMPKLGYTLAECEVLSGVSRATLYRSIQAGALKTVRHGDRQLVCRNELEAFLAHGKAA